MKLVTAKQMRELDWTAIEKIGIPGIVLMENASRGVFEVISAVEAPLDGNKAVIVCGRGNNGGDGFAVARHLVNAGAAPVIALCADSEKIAGDALTNLDICRKLKIPIVAVPSEKHIKKLKALIKDADFIVDALLGTGVTGELKPFFLAIVGLVNDSKRTVYAVDVPSGLAVDDGRVLNGCVRAHHTVTFGAPKIGLFVYPGAGYSGRVYVADIGIPTRLAEQLETDTRLTSPSFIMKHLPARRTDAHKTNCGRVLVIGGSRGMSGAPCLTALSALRTGSGIVYMAVPEGIADTVDRTVTEGITLPMPEDSGAFSAGAFKSIEKKMNEVDAAVLGPGMSATDSTMELVGRIIASSKIPMIVDADGLNCLSRMKNLKILKSAKARIVLTPHPGEMARLLKSDTKSVQSGRLNAARAFAKKHGVVLVLKGAGTITASPGGLAYVNPTGNPGMATAGSGDVLSGIIGSLLGEGTDAFAAAVCGAYLHGAAGDMAAGARGKRPVIAGDLVRCLHRTLKKFEDKENG